MSIQTVTMASLPYDEFMGDLRNRYTLRLAILEIVEAAISMGLHILREKQEAEKSRVTRKQLKKLVEIGVVSAEVGDEVAKLVGLRNLSAHRYWEVDDLRIYREAGEVGLSSLKDL